MTLLQNRQLRNAIAGGIGGFLSWLLLIEPLIAPRLNSPKPLAEMLATDLLFGAVAGLGIGLCLGAAEGLVNRSWAQARRGGLIGAGLGLVGGAIGLMVGELVYQPLAWLFCVGRAVGWGVFGAILGTSEGLTRRSWLGVRNGALGGLIGGAIGGLMFDLVGVVVIALTGMDGPSRGIALTILGAMIGFWLAAMERALSPGRFKVISGQMEGREFLIDKPRLTIGSSERCDIAIFGDPEIAAQHATLRWKDEIFVIEASPGASVAVNGQPVMQQALQSEDQLVLGRTRCIFRTKAAQGVLRPRGLPQQPTPAQPTSMQPGEAVVRDGTGWRSDFPLPTAPGAGGRPATAGVMAPAMAVTQFLDLRTGRRYPVAGSNVTIGRDSGNTIVINDATLSGRHALVDCSNGRCVVYDQGSRNGIYVNGRRVQGSNLVKPGWQLQLGDVVLRAE